MFYENSVQEIKALDTIQSNKSNNNNTFRKEINLPDDLSNSNISLEENNQRNNNENNINNKIKKIKNTKIKTENNIINGNKMKKHNIIDFISETNSKVSDRNLIKKEKDLNKDKSKEEDIKIEENNIIYNGNNTNKNNNNNINNEEEEEYIENNNNDLEDNKIISTSEGFHNSYMDIKSTSQKNEDQYINSNNSNENIKINKINKNNFNYNNKKVQKLEKILKQKILKNESHFRTNKTPNQEDIFYNNYNTNQNQNRTQEYNMNDFPNFTPILKNNNNNYNLNRRNNLINQSNLSEKESNFDNVIENISERNNPIQKYFQINTPGNYNTIIYLIIIIKEDQILQK